ncbi:MAG TPA: hypothetical protein DCS35_04060 [Vibrio sp.]|nr:hypothetical protein [Vibrio sp.]
MIIATLDRLSEDKIFGEIIRQVIAEDLNSMPEGINKINGDDVFVNRIRGNARAIEDSMLELHKEYIDIHLTLSGYETIGFGIQPESEPFMQQQPFENDCELQAEVVNEQFVTLAHQQYCVFMPREWHRPMVKHASHADTVDKVVIKIRASIL